MVQKRKSHDATPRPELAPVRGTQEQPDYDIFVTTKTTGDLSKESTSPRAREAETTETKNFQTANTEAETSPAKTAVVVKPLSTKATPMKQENSSTGKEKADSGFACGILQILVGVFSVVLGIIAPIIQVAFWYIFIGLWGPIGFFFVAGALAIRASKIDRCSASFLLASTIMSILSIVVSLALLSLSAAGLYVDTMLYYNEATYCQLRAIYANDATCTIPDDGMSGGRIIVNIIQLCLAVTELLLAVAQAGFGLVKKCRAPQSTIESSVAVEHPNSVPKKQAGKRDLEHGIENSKDSKGQGSCEQMQSSDESVDQKKHRGNVSFAPSTKPQAPPIGNK